MAPREEVLARQAYVEHLLVKECRSYTSVMRMTCEKFGCASSTVEKDLKVVRQKLTAALDIDRREYAAQTLHRLDALTEAAFERGQLSAAVGSMALANKLVGIDTPAGINVGGPKTKRNKRST
ncbi:MAG: hypothetical protein VKI42_03075 [Synechococcaceae cyanobacterium]|nr:hypothetical protein [Synechococcaceae cyanobacterium]